MLATISTVKTSAVILGIDFLINIYICLKIIYINKRRPNQEEKQAKLIQELVINEIVEFMVPMACLVSFAVAYYGPNAELIGGVGNGYWQYSPIENINRAIKNMFMFFLVDLGSLIVSGLLLWICCRININRAYATIQKEFGVLFTVQMASTLNAVRTK